ncbi:MAG: hypothetical protein QM831_26025 [Kofleriaceae bacterium]
MSADDVHWWSIGGATLDAVVAAVGSHRHPIRETGMIYEGAGAFEYEGRIILLLNGDLDAKIEPRLRKAFRDVIALSHEEDASRFATAAYSVSVDDGEDLAITGDVPANARAVIDDDAIAREDVPLELAHQIAKFGPLEDSFDDVLVTLLLDHAWQPSSDPVDPPAIVIDANGEVTTDEDWPSRDVVACTPDQLVVLFDGSHLAYTIDLRVWPPVAAPLVSREVETACARYFAIDEDLNSVFAPVATPDAWFGLPFSNIGRLCDVGDATIAIPAAKLGNGDRRPVLLRNGTITSLDVPPFEKDTPWEEPLAFRFGDGSYLVAMAGQLYRILDGVTTELGAMKINAINSVAPADDGSLYIADDAYKLWQLWPDGRRVDLGREDVYQLARGPEGTLLCFGVGCDIVWPNGDVVELFGEDEFPIEGSICHGYYDARRSCIVAVADAFASLPWAAVSARRVRSS